MLAIVPFLAQLIAAVTWACLLAVAGDRLATILAADVLGRGSNRRPADALSLVARGGRPVNVWGDRIDPDSGKCLAISNCRTG